MGVVLATLGLPRSTWYYRRSGRRSYEHKYAYLRGPLEEIALGHAEYGYRRTAAELRESYGHEVNRKVVQRLHRLWDLPLLRTGKAPRPSGIRRVIAQAGPRANLVAPLQRIAPLQVLYTDFTELPCAGGKAFLAPILDHASKVVLGWALGRRAITDLALQAWSRARRPLNEWGIAPAGMILHHDQDPVFTSYAWASQLAVKDCVRLSYTLNGAKDNPEMESFIGRFKTENRSLLWEAEDIQALAAVVDQRIDYYNRERRHSSLGNTAPWAYLQEATAGHRPSH